jgi:hypothetical protein
MIARPLFTAAALAFGLLAAAPAMAGSTFRTDVTGYDDEVDGQTRDGAYWGVYVDGDGNAVDGRVAGPGTRVATASLGRGTTTHTDVQGYDNQVGSVARSGGSITARVRGDENEAALYASQGSRVASSIRGDGNYVRGEAR